LRTEQDAGRVTLMDNRILTKRHGRAILDSLPAGVGLRRETAWSGK
jgi:Rad3-related DNA helicase